MSAKTNEDFSFDANQLKKKYKAERDKRIRVDGNEQYREIKGDLAYFQDDPYIKPGYQREPLKDESEVVIIGGGFGGLLTAARLRQAGVKDIRMIERGGDFGGTWYWNRYPGAMCDVESYIYLPLLEELKYIPKEKYTHAPEILSHSKNIAKKFDLYSNACLQTEVTELKWDEEISRWIISTNRDDKMKAKFVCMSNGPLNKPKLPGIKGVKLFGGHSFHTSRWDYKYTGGSSEGNLVGLKGKKVAVIGTGATAVQAVPHIGEMAEELFVFQRTPSSIDERNNRPTDKKWSNKLKPGWQQERMDNFNTLVSGGFQDEDLVNDGWTDIIRNLAMAFLHNTDGEMSHEKLIEMMENADYQKMEQIRARAQELVNDENTAESLKPYYRQFCKRPCFHDDYLQTFNKSNVRLVDTEGKGVEKITKHGVVFDGKEYKVDCLIYATGFEVGTSYTRRSGYDVIGKNKTSLSKKWENGIRTMHGMHVEGFPNCLIMGQQQSAFTVNYPHLLDEQSKNIAYIIKHVQDNKIKTLEVSKKAEEEWVQTIIESAQIAIGFLESCTPGYYNNEGNPTERSAQNGSYGGGSIAFFALMEKWREEDKLKGLILNK